MNCKAQQKTRQVQAGGGAARVCCERKMNDFIDVTFVFLRLFEIALEIVLNKSFDFVQSFEEPTHSQLQADRFSIKCCMFNPHTHTRRENEMMHKPYLLCSMLSF